MTATEAKGRLEYLRGELRAERISYGELAELESLRRYIDADDVELLSALGDTAERKAEGMTLAKFLLRRGYKATISPDFGETEYFCEAYCDQLLTSDDAQDRENLNREVYTMEGDNGTQVYIRMPDDQSDLMIGVLGEPTPVIFRKFSEGDVIAVMPTISEGGHNVRSYQQLGQHGTCDRSIIWTTKPATEAEYKSVKSELESAPYFYCFKVIRRWPARGRN